MKILIPSAKELNLAIKDQSFQALSPKTKEIVATFSELSLAEIQKAYKINEDMAAKVQVQWQALQKQNAQTYPAYLLLDGLMYRQFNKESYTQEESQYIHDFLAITSALYGVIPADTPIAPYRLDFQTKGKIQGQSLRKFWQSSFDQAVKNEEIILSLLSSEFEEVFGKDLQQNFYQCVFMEEKEGKRKIHSTISKKARGKMVKELISHKIQSIDDIRKLTFDGFSLQKDESTDKRLVFVKKV